MLGPGEGRDLGLLACGEAETEEAKGTACKAKSSTGLQSTLFSILANP
jgi:hypothetical protein